MGFVSGFTGGVTLTLSLAYLSALHHQRTREQQGQALRAQALALQGLVEPFPPLPPPRRSEVAAAQRENAIEVAKDRWNHEIENAVRWVQRTDWIQVREDVESGVSRLWGGSEGAELASAKVAAAAQGAFDAARDKSKEVINATLESGKEIVKRVEGGVQSTLTPVQIALSQRFEKPDDKPKKTVEEALKERYTPMDKRNNSVLRGL